MALTNKIGNLFKKAISSNPSVYQAIRCMSSSKLFVGGLSYGTDDQSLREAFTSYGEVVEARVIMDRETGRSRGFGFVTFTSGDEASTAINGMDGKDLHGRIVRVNYATDRTGSRGGYGGGYGGGGYGAGGGYGGGGGYSAGGGYGGGAGGYGGGGSYGGGGGNYSGDNYSSGGGGYGGNSGGGGGSYSVAGGGGGNDNYVSGGGADGYGGSGSYGGSSTMGYGSSGDQQSNNMSSAGAGYENGSQDDLDDNDQPDDYANKRG